MKPINFHYGKCIAESLDPILLREYKPGCLQERKRLQTFTYYIEHNQRKHNSFRLFSAVAYVYSSADYQLRVAVE